MSRIDTARNILQARIIYWGPAGSGKTSSLNGLRRHLDPEAGTHLYSIAGRDGGTFLFDLLPVDEFRLGHNRVRTRVVAAPGASERAAAREVLARDADAVVFVADARREAATRNLASYNELLATLERAGLDPKHVPLVVALNHCDQAVRIRASEIAEMLGLDGTPVYETAATEGRGLVATFSDIFRRLVSQLVQEHGITGLDPETLEPSRVLPSLADADDLPPRDGPALHLVVDAGASDPELAAVEAQLGLVEAHVEAVADNAVLESRNRELMAVNRVARSILSAMDADNLLVVLLDSTAEYLRASYASCVLFDPAETGALRTHVRGFGRDPVLGLPQEAAAHFFELLRNSDGPVPASEKYNVSLLKSLQRVDGRVLGAMFQPIKSDRGKPAGWIGIYSAKEHLTLSTQQVLFLSSISRLAALGLEKIELLDRVTQTNAEQEEAVRTRTGQLEMANAKIRALNRGLESRVTERTRALEEANRKLKEARASAVHGARLRGMGQLAASFAHEVNNPVAGLTANLDYMRENLDELRARIAVAAPDAAAGLEALDEYEEVIAESHESARRIAAIIDSLKRFGGEEDPIASFSLNAVVADTVTLLDERLRACSELDLHLNDLPQLAGDDRELRHVVHAILTNAVEAVERTGARGQIVVTSFATSDKVTLVIKDSGAGIDPALLPKVFEPFVSSKDGEPGAGLGLHSAYKTVKQQGGTIRLRSKPGEGTTVTVVLPTTVAVEVEA